MLPRCMVWFLIMSLTAVTNGAKVIHIRRLKLDPGVNLLS
ncbi:hypothetical protein ETAE_1597 [Edwardsiella piscicida]|uniref:Uncharacterized protein n=1 Tax=Edwardsiella piscicida TaxID=1263550 RepID=A0AAU8P383_EDWPI|nr:hypothetical protein ETAE_1597 [Edwardsiella tarda EIB202]